jgi:hypothetical protein
MGYIAGRQLRFGDRVVEHGEPVTDFVMDWSPQMLSAHLRMHHLIEVDNAPAGDLQDTSDLPPSLSSSPRVASPAAGSGVTPSEPRRRGRPPKALP